MTARRSALSLLAPAALLVAVVMLPACVQFQPAVLYSGVEPAPVPERPRMLSLAVEPVVYEDQNDDTVWFQEDTNCTQGRVTQDVVYEGRRAVEVSWDRGAEGCDWAGLGFGWDGWAGKDLSQLLPYAAFEMQVRSKEGTMYGLPIVLTLEDYSGGMGFAYTDNKYFERTFIDEEWQKVVVPLSAFDMDVENLDATNVKQLMMELQGSGSIYLDDIQLVFYEAQEQEPWLVEAPRPSPTALPIQLFDDAFINSNGWGLVTDACQSIEPTQANPSTGSTALHLQWDVRPEGCYEAAMGVSWDRWYPVNLTPIFQRAAVQFDIRLPSGTASSLPIRVGLEDYSRQFLGATLDGRSTPSGQFTAEWQTVTIPLSDLRPGGRQLAASPATVGGAPTRGEFDVSNVKQLVFFMDEQGDVFIDNVRLVDTY
ncbi:MAG: glycan-binding surface protein [Rhodothermales bacterium]